MEVINRCADVSKQQFCSTQSNEGKTLNMLQSVLHNNDWLTQHWGNSSAFEIQLLQSCALTHKQLEMHGCILNALAADNARPSVPTVLSICYIGPVSYLYIIVRKPNFKIAI